MNSPASKTSEIKELEELSSEFSHLYLNPQYSDLALIISGEKIPVHKAILSVRTRYFASGFESNTINEIPIAETNPETFKILLKYIYTGVLNLTGLKIETLLDLLSQAVQFGVKSLRACLTSQNFISLINLDNVVAVLNASISHHLDQLVVNCENYLDLYAYEILRHESFLNLSEESVVKLLKRESFAGNDEDIFAALLKWCRNDEEKARNLLKSANIPSKRIKLVLDQNVASHEIGAKVVTGENTNSLLHDEYHHKDNAVFHVIQDGIHGIVIELNDIYVINNIRFRLDDSNKLFDYKYFVEVAGKNKEWIKVVDYRDFRCRSWQDIYFERRQVMWIHIVGTTSFMCNNEFRLYSLGAYCRPVIPRFNIENSIIYPTWNVACLEKNAIIWSYSHVGDACLDGTNKNFSSAKLGLNGIRIRLAQPFIVSSLRFLLPDFDDRVYSYYVETSVDDKNWILLADKRDEKCRSWQVFHFEERPVVFLHFVGNFSSATETLDIVYIECPITDEKI